jgi:uncharacterized repeat protein (TIGR03803 family)
VKIRNFSSALIIAAVAALLAGCAGPQPPLNSSPDGFAQQRSLAHSAYRVLHNFGGSGDGINPSAGLINVNGTLYGTTVNGGANNSAGTVFAISETGEETVLHSFGGPGDGVQPEAGLIDVKGTLYGTTRAGGAYDFGTVFSITTTGKEKVLHSFDFNYTDGVWPFAGLVDVNGTLYGTTSQGGAYACGSASCGAVFSITTSGTEKVLLSFNGSDGSWPMASLIDIKGLLYSTTSQGGAHGVGTVFSVTTSGTEDVLYNFISGKSGGTPMAGVIDVKGRLYGTTSHGGTYYGGAVFSMRGGIENLAYSFNGGDGSSPEAGFIDVNGTLYSTTSQGGTHNDGTVYSFTTGGSEKVLHSFAAGTNGNYPDGSDPVAGVIDVNGTLYGTTHSGGLYGDGIVFSLKP